MNEEVQLPSSSHQNHSPVIVKNELKLKQLDNATLVHSSFVTRKTQCKHSEDLERGGDEGSRKPLSLKVRKRKYRTIASPENESTKCDNSSSIPTILNQDGLSDSEIDLLSMYSGHIQKQVHLSDLSTRSYEKKAHTVSSIPERTHPLTTEQTTSKLSTPVKLSNPSPLPVSPTFSPRKNSLKHFSPFLESKANRSLLDTSVLLFSTPDDSNLHVSSVIQTPVSSRRKALFPKTKTASQDDLSEVKKEYDFGLLENINLSDLLDESDLSNWSFSLTGQSPSLCRYLVLEKVSQMSCNLER